MNGGEMEGESRIFLGIWGFRCSFCIQETSNSSLICELCEEVGLEIKMWDSATYRQNLKSWDCQVTWMKKPQARMTLGMLGFYFHLY